MPNINTKIFTKPLQNFSGNKKPRNKKKKITFCNLLSVPGNSIHNKTF